MKKYLIIFFMFLFVLNVNSHAQELTLDCKSAVLADINGNILYEYNMNEPLQPASVTKVMTMLLVLEAVENGDISFDDLVTTSEYASSMGGTQIFLEAGEQMSVEDMLKSVTVASANDAAVALAEHISGSEEAFVELMNARAKELSMNDTTFINANGLDADDVSTLTSAKDIAIMSAEVLKYDKITEFSSIWTDTIRDGAFTLANTNKMLKTYNGMTGLKTGYISKAGYCISATAERDDLQLIATVMGAPSIEARTQAVTALLNYGFANYTQITPSYDSEVLKVPVLLGKEDFVEGRAFDGTPIILPKENANTLEYVVNLEENLKAPIFSEQIIGEILVLSNGEEITKIPVKAINEVLELSIFDIFLLLLANISLF